MQNDTAPLEDTLAGFPGGSMVRNPPANAGDMGSIPGSGRSYMLQSSQAHVPQLLSPCSSAQEPTATEPTEASMHRACAPQENHGNEMSMYHN